MNVSEGIAKVVKTTFGSDVRVLETRAVSGGDINESFLVQLADRRKLFFKRNSADLFSVEAEALDQMRTASASREIRVPEVYGVGFEESLGFYLMMEWIDRAGSGFNDRECQLRFGRQLAEFHLAGIGPRYGWNKDNFIGANPQPNRWKDRWDDFFIENRLEFQLEMASRNGLDTGDSLQEAFYHAKNSIRELLAEPSRPTLIHGDLWSGNYFFDLEGRPVLIDPAAYFADSETEFGMIALFGGLGKEFYNAYSEVTPFRPGFQKRTQLYKLYHLLNHLNLFGRSYYGECLSILRELG